ISLGTNLSTWPALLFTYLEPISVLIGAHVAFTDPVSFTARQLPLPLSASIISPPIPQTAILLAYSLGSVFPLLGLLNILCTAVTRDVRTTKFYLTILACGDMGHMYANYRGMWSAVFWDFRAYNEVMVGNVWITLFLWVNRVATLSGVFGRIRRTGELECFSGLGYAEIEYVYTLTIHNSGRRRRKEQNMP
ncbi:hypothetical protein EJ02DRAFT_332515, partial [Clathrospora elynae]